MWILIYPSEKRHLARKKVYTLNIFRKSSAAVPRFGVHPLYTFYAQSEASVVQCGTNPTWQQKGESRNLKNDFK